MAYEHKHLTEMGEGERGLKRRMFTIPAEVYGTFEIHYVVAGPEGAVCLRVDTGLRRGIGTDEPKNPVLGWHSLAPMKGSNIMASCPCLEGEMCWFKKANYGGVENLYALLDHGLDGPDGLWESLELHYLELTKEDSNEGLL